MTRKAQGGEQLADELLIRTREYLRPQFDDADSMDILVRVYANLEGMANYLVRQDKVRNLGALRAMSTGFCGRISSFDFIDIGVGKEGSSGRKLRGEHNNESALIAKLTSLQKTCPSIHRVCISATSSWHAHLRNYLHHFCPICR